MKIIDTDSIGIDLKITFEDNSVRVFCGKAIDCFYESIGGFHCPIGKEFNLSKFSKIWDAKNFTLEDE